MNGKRWVDIDLSFIPFSIWIMDVSICRIGLPEKNRWKVRVRAYPEFKYKGNNRSSKPGNRKNDLIAFKRVNIKELLESFREASWRAELMKQMRATDFIEEDIRGYRNEIFIWTCYRFPGHRNPKQFLKIFSDKTTLQSESHT